MLTPAQKQTLKIFMDHATPAFEDCDDTVEEVTSFKLRGRQSQLRDRAVALYWHRVRLEKQNG